MTALMAHEPIGIVGEFLLEFGIGAPQASA